MCRVEKIFQWRNDNTFFVDYFKQIRFFCLIFEENPNMVIVASHEESMDWAEDRFVPEEDNVEVRGVIEDLSRGNRDIIPVVDIGSAYFLIALGQFELTDFREDFEFEHVVFESGNDMLDGR